jgi:hypothetical protein
MLKNPISRSRTSPYNLMKIDTNQPPGLNAGEAKRHFYFALPATTARANCTPPRFPRKNDATASNKNNRGVIAITN